MKVKYNGDQNVRHQGYDFKPGETREVSPGFEFINEEFEQVDKPAPKKTSKKQAEEQDL